MKLIDLLNKKANEEELPKKIKAYDEIFTLTENVDEVEDLYTDEDGDRLFYDFHWFLNDEVEIIEEEIDETIEEIKEINKSYPIFNFDAMSFEAMKNMLQDVYEKQSEIIKTLNELRKENK